MFRSPRPLLLFLASAHLVGAALPVHAAVRPTEAAESPALPEIWQKVPAQQRLMALRAAEVDGTRLLLERIMGLHTSSDTTVRDLTLSSDTVRGMLSASIKGVTSSEPPQYFPDGRVEVVRAVKVQQLIEVVNRVIQQQKLADGSTKTVSDGWLDKDCFGFAKQGTCASQRKVRRGGEQRSPRF
jgi:hypothetical protein